jgi:glycosyltransferase involved in cell wall biosynthesis
LFTVAICTHDRADDLRRAIESVLEQGFDPARHELLVVDNASTDGTAMLVERLATRRPGIRLVRESAIGLSRARNRAWREARGQYVVYLDDDAKAADGWLAAIERIIAERRPVAFGGPFFPFYLTPKPRWYQDAFGSRELGKAARWLGPGEDLSGGNMALRRDALERLGGFDPTLGMIGDRVAYGEESALFHALIAQEGDRAVYYDPAMAILHLVRAEKMTWRWRLRELVARARDHWRVRLGAAAPPGVHVMLWETLKAVLMLAANLSVRIFLYHRSRYPTFGAYLFYRGLEPVGIVGYWKAWLHARRKKL